MIAILDSMYTGSVVIELQASLSLCDRDTQELICLQFLQLLSAHTHTHLESTPPLRPYQPPQDISDIFGQFSDTFGSVIYGLFRSFCPKFAGKANQVRNLKIRFLLGTFERKECWRLERENFCNDLWLEYDANSDWTSCITLCKVCKTKLKLKEEIREK